MLREKNRQEMIIRKRNYARKQLNKRLEEVRKKDEEAERGLEKVLKKKEKKNNLLLNDIILSKDLFRNKKKMEEDERKNIIQQAQKEGQKREDECKIQNDIVRQEKIQYAKKKKEKKR